MPKYYETENEQRNRIHGNGSGNATRGMISTCMQQ
jgi:hypothetical protein